MVGDAFKALGDPTRRRILELLSEGEMSAGDIAAHFDMAKPSVSHHLNILKNAGLVTDERRGQNIVYCLNLTVFQEAADMAYKEIPGEGPVVGTKRHKFATEYLKEYQTTHGDRQIKTNVNFIDKKIGKKGIIDIVDYKNKVIYDFKFGYPNKTPEILNNTKQMQWYRKNMNNWPSYIIKPKIKY